MIRPDHLMSRSFGSGMFHTDIFRFRGVRSPEPSEFASLDLLRSPQDRRQNKRAPIKAPNTKHQAPNSREAPSSKIEARATVWRLELGISLVFGAWFLVFRFRDFSGAWGLVHGVSLRVRLSWITSPRLFLDCRFGVRLFWRAR